ncbi:hypothetical protein F511_28680 [Dorcoceras hygrometricum]|uniref:Peroxisome biogenesis protein 2 n=1 Tax=Dorcoceras hygrometricum TaxID=472368 RepID=A0A2Z7D2M1_9LAMI|nr:hypothetical protein F511_28680 [Dorcoceras hygrometricum]
MSLFDLQDVCIAIGSIATLDLPMVVDLIGIYGLKGPYRTLTTTDWFLQALSVIPRGSWGDVARRFTMIRWAGLLVQPDEGVSELVVDRIGVNYRNLPRRVGLLITVGARHKCQRDRKPKSGSPPRRARAVARATPSRAGRAMETLASRAGPATHAWWPDECDEDGRWSWRSVAQGRAHRCAWSGRESPHLSPRPRRCVVLGWPDLLRCWMRDAAGLLLRIIVRRCAAPAPPATRRLCDAGSLVCARPCWV